VKPGKISYATARLPKEKENPKSRWKKCITCGGSSKEGSPSSSGMAEGRTWQERLLSAEGRRKSRVPFPVKMSLTAESDIMAFSDK
jgi:hypothetical protein